MNILGVGLRDRRNPGHVVEWTSIQSLAYQGGEHGPMNVTTRARLSRRCLFSLSFLGCPPHQACLIFIRPHEDALVIAEGRVEGKDRELRAALASELWTVS